MERERGGRARERRKRLEAKDRREGDGREGELSEDGREKLSTTSSNIVRSTIYVKRVQGSLGYSYSLMFASWVRLTFKRVHMNRVKYNLVSLPLELI